MSHALPLEGCKHRREFPAGDATVIAAPGWSLYLVGEYPADNTIRVDPSRIDGLIEALQAAKRHQRGKNPR